jgi:hypothetical protein
MHCGRSALPLGGGGWTRQVRWTGLCHSSIIHVTLACLLVQNPEGVQVPPRCRLYPCCPGQFFQLTSSHREHRCGGAATSTACIIGLIANRLGAEDRTTIKTCGAPWCPLATCEPELTAAPGRSRSWAPFPPLPRGSADRDHSSMGKVSSTVLMSLEIAEQSAPQAQPPVYPAQDGVQGALRPEIGPHSAII